MIVWLRLIALIFTCASLEYTVSILTPLDYVVNALLDSSIHFLTGALCWFIIFEGPFLEVFVCGILSSVIDIDHFLSAKSLSLKDALSLSNRPIFHSVIAIPVVAFLCGITGRILIAVFGHCWLVKQDKFKLILYDLPYLILVAWTSHQLRDSIRRGLWLWPFGSLPKTPHWLYFCIIAGVPLIINIVLYRFYPHLIQNRLLVTEHFSKSDNSAQSVIEV